MLHLAKKMEVSERRKSKIQDILFLKVENSVPGEGVASLKMLLSSTLLSLLLMEEKRRAVRKTAFRN